MRLTPDELNARKRRNLFIALGLVAFIILVFLTTVLRLQQNQADARAALEGPGVIEAEPAAR
ncbi:hypothetical protein MU852_12730 [Brevundimonas albigilva]|uniref:Cytochrome C oxidase assembly protein n=1 Tax=Brevundimonas albigilva TaxID=1312364 RepID=A0ABY4SN09_9CAUL|nr:hypothetical protein [Brevundimonas albigilva]UQV17685.1 hypothetical protein MU852_12730 [Brevundimonas albigilva]URI14439.1 hypothetical protein M8231_11485 [Brevundimonas albigilva]